MDTYAALHDLLGRVAKLEAAVFPTILPEPTPAPVVPITEPESEPGPVPEMEPTSDFLEPEPNAHAEGEEA